MLDFSKPLTEVSHYSGISQSALWKIVKGKTKKPKKETMKKLLTYLMGG